MVKSFITERKGERDDMQDAAILIDDCTKQYKEIKSAILLYDYILLQSLHNFWFGILYSFIF